MDYGRIRPFLDIESNLKRGIVRGGRSEALLSEERPDDAEVH